MKPRLVFWTVLAVLFLGCGGGSGPQAPEILYGQDICDHCRMVISEERHAAAVELEAGERRFDDPGCLVSYLAAETEAHVVGSWVHDESGSWLPVGEAWLVIDPERRTPMGSGILTFDSAEAAGAAADRLGGAVLRWTDVRGMGDSEEQ